MRRQRNIKIIDKEIEREKKGRISYRTERCRIFRNRIVDQVEDKIRKEIEEHDRWKEDQTQGRLMYKTGKEREAKKMKERQAQGKVGWYKKGGCPSVLWVPGTQEGELLERIKELKKTCPPEETKMKLVKKGGKVTSSAVTNRGKMQRENCMRKQCQPCHLGGRKKEAGANAIKGGLDI
jgi:hypothetical protein